MSIAENLERVRQRIAAAAERSARQEDGITLVGVTKYVGPREAAELVGVGCLDLGESRPQELWQKHGAVALAIGQAPEESNVRWHLIGHLQRNKIRRTLPLVDMIHSIDSERLMAAIDEELARSSSSRTGPLEVLLEVNTSREAAKHGLELGEVEPLLASAASFKHVAIRGLMTMAPLEGGLVSAARSFATLRELRDRLKPLVPECVKLDELSMGMSGDFEVAIAEGATIVRIGSALWET